MCNRIVSSERLATVAKSTDVVYLSIFPYRAGQFFLSFTQKSIYIVRKSVYNYVVMSKRGPLMIELATLLAGNLWKLIQLSVV
jgi:hypothetical protein